MNWLYAVSGVLAAGGCAWALWRLRAARAKLCRERATRAAQEERMQRLERVAARNAAILQSAMDGFFVLGEDYRFLEVNEAFCRMTGYRPDELLRMKITDLEVAQPVLAPAPATHLSTGLHHFATAHRHRDGHVIQLESCVIVLRDAGEKILVGFARDITERCRSEDALRKSEKQYRDFVETSRDLIWAMDAEGRWTFLNNAARQIYGYEPYEMLGRCFTEFMSPERAQRDWNVFESVAAGTPLFHYTTEHVRKDGSAVQISFNARPITDDYGNVAGATGTATDISHWVEAERKLRDANARFQSLVAGMPLGYIVWARDGRVLDWNPAATAILGYAAEEALGRPLHELIVTAEGAGAFDEVRRGLFDGQPCSGVVFVNRRKSGETIKCEWFNTVLRDSVGGDECVATLIRDVSERERLEAQLRQSQKLESLGVLAGGVAHDFNNLLVGILGNASIALEQTSDGSLIRKHLQKVVNAGLRATELTQRMLAYAGRAAVDVRPMDLNALVEEMADFAGSAVPKSTTLTTRLQADLPPIEGDSSQVQQVIMNLLINAAEAIDSQDGTVTVSTTTQRVSAAEIAATLAYQQLAPGEYVCLDVRDTGHGMSRETLARIFEPFFTTKRAGRGLGLSAILGIVRAHRGAITVESAPGQGTAFRVLLPVARRRPESTARPAAPQHLPVGSTVLVIDDEEDIREVVESVLVGRGIRVLLAEDGESGVALFRSRAHEIDAVLLDMNMPGMDGETVFRELQRVRPDVKVLLSSGYTEQETAARFADARLAGFVRKPYTAAALVDKIGAALGAGGG